MQSLLRRTWRAGRKAFTVLFLIAVAVILIDRARDVDWAQVGSALRAFEPSRLLLAGLFAALGHTIYACYDLLGRKYTRHDLPALRVMGITFVSYAFNLNFGAIIGGVAFRYRLYSRLGLRHAVTGRILGLSILTNWLGYVALAGLLLLSRSLPVPANWPIPPFVMPLLGAALLLAVLVYFVLCALHAGRVIRLWHARLQVPSPRLALVQLGLSMAHWLVVAAVVHVLLGPAVGYAVVLSVLLSASVMGAVLHVPAGLGVIEAVFLALLGARLGQGPVLAALFAYRALYYLMPLGVATVSYLLLEHRARRAAADA